MAYQMSGDNPDKVLSTDRPALTSITVPFGIKLRLDEKKLIPREPYYSVIQRLLDLSDNTRDRKLVSRNAKKVKIVK